MKARSFKYKIMIPTVAIQILLVLVINIFIGIRLSRMGNSLIDEKLFSVTNSLRYYMDESEGKSHVAAISMAHNPLVVQAVGNRDTEALLRLFTDACDLYRIDYFTITDEKGDVLARTYIPDNRGDSITNQQNIRDALDGKVSTYYESGTYVRVSIRTGAPVYRWTQEVIGVVSAGVRFDTDQKVEELKELFDADVTVFYGDVRVATSIVRDGISLLGTRLDARIAETVFGDKLAYLGDADIFGEAYKTYYLPLLNADYDAFAAIFVGIPLAKLTTDTNSTIRDGIILGLGGLTVSIFLLYLLISSLSQPITQLSNDMLRIASGTLSIHVSIKSNDEVGILGRSLQKVADTLYKLMAEINKTIEEHENGNVEYFLDTEDFFGDYKILADNIIELAATGMRDQLTGIPNRRTFDRRLEMEWGRSKREGTPLSMLMMDVDLFKTYNDTFGHPQGDVALRTVANAITQSLRRSTDFAARWGGEEFAVLLPGTNGYGANLVAEHIRMAVEKALIPCDDVRGGHLTISIGVSSMIPERDSMMQELVDAADAGLYNAKSGGRNKVVYISA